MKGLVDVGQVGEGIFRTSWFADVGPKSGAGKRNLPTVHLDKSFRGILTLSISSSKLLHLCINTGLVRLRCNACANSAPRSIAFLIAILRAQCLESTANRLTRLTAPRCSSYLPSLSPSFHRSLVRLSEVLTGLDGSALRSKIQQDQATQITQAYVEDDMYRQLATSLSHLHTEHSFQCAGSIHVVTGCRSLVHPWVFLACYNVAASGISALLSARPSFGGVSWNKESSWSSHDGPCKRGLSPARPTTEAQPSRSGPQSRLGVGPEHL